jgi:predicted AAA+ superfamily ATPase
MMVLTLDTRGTEQVDGRNISCIPVWEWLLGRAAD